MQIYVMVHLREVVSRLKRCGRGDHGAFVPWIVLYEGRTAQIGTVIMLTLPVVGTLSVVVNHFEQGSATSLIGAMSILGLLCATALTVVCWRYAEDLRRVAVAHRDGSSITTWEC